MLWMVPKKRSFALGGFSAFSVPLHALGGCESHPISVTYRLPLSRHSNAAEAFVSITALRHHRRADLDISRYYYRDREYGVRYREYEVRYREYGVRGLPIPMAPLVEFQRHCL